MRHRAGCVTVPRCYCVGCVSVPSVLLCRQCFCAGCVTVPGVLLYRECHCVGCAVVPGVPRVQLCRVSHRAVCRVCRHTAASWQRPAVAELSVPLRCTRHSRAATATHRWATTPHSPLQQAKTTCVVRRTEPGDGLFIHYHHRRSILLLKAFLKAAKYKSCIEIIIATPIFADTIISLNHSA